MHDLRRQALESGKTVSRKARSKPSSAVSSRGNSAPNSRTASRNPSRNVSDDEEGNLSDGTAWSTNSIDDMIMSEDADAQPDAWRTELSDRMEQIIDRKRSSVQGREESLSAYTHIITAQFAQPEIHSKLGELVPALLKSVKGGASEKETVVALKALAVTLITDPSDTIYDAVYQPLKQTISDSESTLTKIAAIHTLGTATFYGGASEEETQDVMDYLLEIIESDGNSVDAADNGEVVTAALEEWGFLATQLEDMEDSTEPALDAFVEQLESSDPSVQIAAGENIALLYEKSHTELEDDEDAPPNDSDSDSDASSASDPNAPVMVKRYMVYRREDQLKHTLESLANLSTRRLSKKDKKSLHTNFADILNSVANPTRGPRYQNAVNQETGKRYGSRMTVRIHKAGEMRIDRWWKLHRLKALRRVLQGGFVNHYEHNEVVFDSLPIMIARK
ncbi:interferon-related developmental regulator-domain-containing protein [Cryomyces antarcticus]